MSLQGIFEELKWELFTLFGNHPLIGAAVDKAHVKAKQEQSVASQEQSAASPGKEPSPVESAEPPTAQQTGQRRKSTT